MGAGSGFIITVFVVLLALTVWILIYGSRRVKSLTHFWAAGRAVSGPQNGIAMSGDFLGAATLLGSVGLIMLYGFDGSLYSVGWLVGFVVVLFFVAERLRNAGRYTMADALTIRLQERPIRCVVAANTLLISTLLLVSQLLGAGVLLEALVGVPYKLAVLITTIAFMCYVMIGGMVSVTLLQVVKALILAGIVLVMAIWVLAKVGFNPGELLLRAASKAPEGDRFLEPGLFLTNVTDTVSLGLALALGVAGLPNLLIRFFTVKDRVAARSSVVWGALFIGIIYLLVFVIGLGARAFLTPAQVKAAGPGGNLAAPELVQVLGGGSDTWGGQLFFAVFAAVAFATALAYVAGVVIAASSAASHDIYSRVIRRGRATSKEELRMARLTTCAIALVGLLLAFGVENMNIVFLAGLVTTAFTPQFDTAWKAGVPVLVVLVLAYLVLRRRRCG